MRESKRGLTCSVRFGIFSTLDTSTTYAMRPKSGDHVEPLLPRSRPSTLRGEHATTPDSTRARNHTPAHPLTLSHSRTYTRPHVSNTLPFTRNGAALQPGPTLLNIQAFTELTTKRPSFLSRVYRAGHARVVHILRITLCLTNAGIDERPESHTLLVKSHQASQRLHGDPPFSRSATS